MMKKYYPLMSLPILALSFPSTVLAVVGPNGNNSPQVRERVQERVEQRLENKADQWSNQVQKWNEKWQGALKEQVQEKINQARERICTATQNRVNARWQKYYDSRMNRVENMERGLLKLQERVQYFKEQGLDTKKLEADIVTLQQLVNEYKSAYTQFLNALEEAKTIPCANYEGKFLPELKQAREEWLVVRAKAKAIKDFYLSNVKPHLLELRQALANKNLESKE